MAKDNDKLKNVSIVDIAKLAGVSHMTVSRVMNNEGNVSPKTTMKIRAVMEEVGYVPQPPSMRRGPRRTEELSFKTGNVAFLTLSKSLEILTKSPVMLSVLNGIDEALASYGMSMIQGAVSATRQLPPIVARGGVDGVIVWPNLDGVPDETLEILRGYKVVYVMTAIEERLPGDRVQNNNRQVGRLAAEYLHEQGHKRVCYFTPSAHGLQPNLRVRWTAFSNYLGQYDIDFELIEVDQDPLDLLETTVEKEKAILEQVRTIFSGADKPTGIFVTCDSLTAKLYTIFNKAGIRPMADVEIVSCNNEVSILSGLEPKPVIIDIRAEDIGRKAVEQLRRRIANPDIDDKITIEVQPRLIRTAKE